MGAAGGRGGGRFNVAEDGPSVFFQAHLESGGQLSRASNGVAGFRRALCALTEGQGGFCVGVGRPRGRPANERDGAL